MEESGFEFKNVRNQYWTTMAANLIMLGHGAVICWFTPSLPKLLSEDTPLVTGPLTNEQLSWLGSINNLGALGGVLTFGFITSFFGCKRAILVLALPSIAFWLLIYFGNTYYHLLFARCFAGWTGGGIQTTIVLFVAEISNDNIRGRLGSLTTLFRNVGVLLIFTIGTYADYFMVPCIFIFLPIIFLSCFSFLPNTPQFYLRNGRIEEAKKALKYYKGYEGKTELEKNGFNKEFERLQSLANVRKEEPVQLSDFFEPKAIKGLLFGIILGWLTQFPGGIAFLNYAVIIFEKSGASYIDPYVSSIILAVAQLFGCFFSTKLADSLGRKLMMIISFMGCAIGLFVFALYLYLNQNGYDLSAFSWLPVASLSFIMFIASAGVYTLYSVCFVEYLPSKIRTIGLTICVLSLYSSSFTFVKVFPFALELLGLCGCMIIFMVGSVVGALFVIFALEETKGKSLDFQPSTLESSATKC